ncbi:hypothetical protein FGF1_03290 [Flavobacteriaceae bacterium GF1]
MTKWMDKLGKWQQVLLATFFGLLGCALWVIPFWFETKGMAKGQEASWPTAYYFFLLFGTIAIGLSLRLSRIDKLFNIGTGFLGKFTNSDKTKKQ